MAVGREGTLMFHTQDAQGGETVGNSLISKSKSVLHYSYSTLSIVLSVLHVLLYQACCTVQSVLFNHHRASVYA